MKELKYVKTFEDYNLNEEFFSKIKSFFGKKSPSDTSEKNPAEESHLKTGSDKAGLNKTKLGEVFSIDKIKSKIELMGIFPTVCAFPGGADAIESLFEVIQQIQQIKNKQYDWDEYEKRLINYEDILANKVKSVEKSGDIDAYAKAQEYSENYTKKVIERFNETIEEIKKEVEKVKK